MDYRCQLCFKIFQVYAINYQKKTPDSQLGIQKWQGAHSKIKSHFRFQDLAKMIPNHIWSKKTFSSQKSFKKSLSLISTFTLVSITTKADFSATNWSLGLDFYKKSPLSSWDTEVFDFADNNVTWWKNQAFPVLCWQYWRQYHVKCASIDSITWIFNFVNRNLVHYQFYIITPQAVAIKKNNQP